MRLICVFPPSFNLWISIFRLPDRYTELCNIRWRCVQFPFEISNFLQMDSTASTQFENVYRNSADDGQMEVRLKNWCVVCMCAWAAVVVVSTPQSALSNTLAFRLVCCAHLLLVHLCRHTQFKGMRTVRTEQRQNENEIKLASCNKHQLWLHILLGQTLFNAFECNNDAREFTLHPRFNNTLLSHWVYVWIGFAIFLYFFQSLQT